MAAAYFWRTQHNELCIHLRRNTFSPDAAVQPPLGDRPIYVPEPMAYPGSSPQLAVGPLNLAEGTATTGLIGYVQPFPIWLALPKGDEQALAVNVAGQGIVLITGCGHMGLENLLARAEAAFAEPIVGVVGGLHYGEASGAALTPQIERLQQLKPIVVALSPHDSGPAARAAFAAAFGTAYQPIAAGEPIILSSQQAAAR
jgi:7,8-dihydropterin-6-yl-methyl-4-(beta-D-ribofuranosyl)aminobenzene 5'-phosphate synthase